MRWISFERPRAALFLHPGLYVSETNREKSGELKRRGADKLHFGEAVRLRGSKVIKRYVIYRSQSVLDAVGP